MSDSSSITGPNWYAVQTLSNQEGKAKKYFDKFIAIEEMDDFVFDVLMPTEQITEVKAGKKSIKTRKFYPGYIFVNMRLYDVDGNLLQKPWYFVREGHGVINFVGGDRPTPLKKSEIDRILNQVEESEGKEKPKIEYEIGEIVKISEIHKIDQIIKKAMKKHDKSDLRLLRNKYVFMKNNGLNKSARRVITIANACRARNQKDILF